MSIDPASSAIGDLRWGTIGDLVDAFGALMRSAGALMAAQVVEGPEHRRQKVDEFIDCLRTVSAAVDFAAGFLDHGQRSRMRERCRDERNKMQHAHWDRQT